MYGSAGTGKTLILCEALKIKLSQLLVQGRRIRVLATTFDDLDTELLYNFTTKYLVNMKNIEVSNLKKLCGELNIKFYPFAPRDTVNRALRTSQSYTLCTDLPKLRNHPNIEKNTSIVNVIDKYIHKLDIYYKKKIFLSVFLFYFRHLNIKLKEGTCYSRYSDCTCTTRVFTPTTGWKTIAQSWFGQPSQKGLFLKNEFYSEYQANPNSPKYMHL